VSELFRNQCFFESRVEFGRKMLP